MNVELEIDKDFAAALCAKMGYTFPSERTERIAREARQLMNQGTPAPSAFANALEDDFLLYGTPET